MDVGLSKKPWEHYEYEYTHKYYTLYGFPQKSSGPFYNECPAKFQTIKDSPRLSYRKCDLIKYDRKYRYELFKDWRDWFPEKPKKKRVQFSKISRYLTGQYGIVIQRFRKTKDKGIIYNDYGTLILLLTGKHKGLIQQWYNRSYPFQTIAKFPYVDPLPKILIKNLTKMLDDDPFILCKNIEDSEEQRNLFLERIWNYFTGEKNEKRRYSKII